MIYHQPVKKTIFVFLVLILVSSLLPSYAFVTDNNNVNLAFAKKHGSSSSENTGGTGAGGPGTSAINGGGTDNINGSGGGSDSSTINTSPEFPSPSPSNTQQQNTCPNDSTPDPITGNCPNTSSTDNTGGGTTNTAPPPFTPTSPTTKQTCAGGLTPDENGNCPNTITSASQQPCPDGQRDANGICLNSPTITTPSNTKLPYDPIQGGCPIGYHVHTNTDTKKDECSKNGTDPVDLLVTTPVSPDGTCPAGQKLPTDTNPECIQHIQSTDGICPSGTSRPTTGRSNTCIDDSFFPGNRYGTYARINSDGACPTNYSNIEGTCIGHYLIVHQGETCPKGYIPSGTYENSIHCDLRIVQERPDGTCPGEASIGEPGYTAIPGSHVCKINTDKSSGLQVDEVIVYDYQGDRAHLGNITYFCPTGYSHIGNQCFSYLLQASPASTTNNSTGSGASGAAGGTTTNTGGTTTGTTSTTTPKNTGHITGTGGGITTTNKGNPTTTIYIKPPHT